MSSKKHPIKGRGQGRFTCKIRLTSEMELDITGHHPMLIGVTSAIDFSDNIDKSQYINADGVPNKLGHKAMIQSFVQGLVATIKSGHQNGHWDEVTELKKVIEELGASFATPTELSFEKEDN